MQIHTCALEGAAQTNHCHSELKKHRTQKKKVQHSSPIIQKEKNKTPHGDRRGTQNRGKQSNLHYIFGKS